MREKFFNFKNAFGRTIIAFIAAVICCTAFSAIMIVRRMQVDRLTMEQLIAQKETLIGDVISKLLYKTYTLSALVIQNDGKIDNFDKAANAIVDDPVILNVLIAPDGVVSDVYPLEGNEAILGLDFFSEGAGNREAILSKELGELVLGGPFNLIQGGQALVGRLPIYMDNRNGKKEFWGLVSVTLKYPQALNAVGLDSLKTQGLAFELWRINPDDGEKQIIAGSDYEYRQSARYLESKITLANAEWYFRILPINAWYEYSETWMLVLISAVLCCLVAFIVHNNQTLSQLKSRLEVMAFHDQLTGIYNRRFFIDLLAIEEEKIKRTDSNAFIIIFDLDHFKSINDNYGHLAGDEVLKTVARKVKSMIRSYDLFARYGGEEFIIMISSTDKNHAVNLAERFRKAINETPIDACGTKIMVSASFGIADIKKSGSAENAIRLADEALYEAKSNGRNKVSFSSGA